MISNEPLLERPLHSMAGRHIVNGVVLPILTDRDLQLLTDGVRQAVERWVLGQLQSALDQHTYALVLRALK